MPATQPRYGWLMVAVAALFNGFAMGTAATVAIFLTPLAAEFGWARGEIMAAYTICGLGMGVGGVVMGHISDRLTTRPVVVFGAIVMGGSLYLLSTMRSLTELYLYFALLGGLGGGAVFAPMIANVGYWFDKDKGLAIGLASAGQAFGQAMVPFASSFLIAAYGWRDTYLTWAGLSLVGLVALALLIRVPPGHAATKAKAKAKAIEASGANGGDAARNWLVVGWLCLATVFCCITMSTPLLHVASMSLDKGFGHDQAATAFALIGLTAMFGRIAYGKLADLIGGLRAYLVGSVVQTAMVFWFTQIDTVPGMYAMSVVFGLGYSGVMTSVAVTTRELTPVHRRGVSWAVVVLFGWVGMGVGAYQGGVFHDLTGAYIVPFGVAVGAGLINMALIAGLLVMTRRWQTRAPAFATA